jgi:hypothetical protein
MSVHKSQGSELDRVAIVLPAEVSPVLSRELLYTAITRARQGVVLFARPEIVRHAIHTGIQRASGLGERLWAAGCRVARSSCPSRVRAGTRSALSGSPKKAAFTGSAGSCACDRRARPAALRRQPPFPALLPASCSAAPAC